MCVIYCLKWNVKLAGSVLKNILITKISFKKLKTSHTRQLSNDLFVKFVGEISQMMLNEISYKGKLRNNIVVYC